MKAFPSSEPIYQDNVIGVKQSTGMDLRDYFAAKAMQGMVTWNLKDMVKNANAFGEEPVDYLVRNAYSIADAMLEVRKEKK
jgi:hypothetical protein